MPTSATGPGTVNYSIPTLLTSADPPDGIGINTIVTSIDATIKTVDNKVAAKPGLGIVIAMGG